MLRNVTIWIGNPLRHPVFASSRPQAAPFFPLIIRDRRSGDRVGRIAARAFREAIK